MKSSKIGKVYGMALIKAENSNYNADFDGLPRTLPDGTLYATDKSLKFLIRTQMIAMGHKVFTYQSRNDKGNFRTLAERYEQFHGKAKPEDVLTNVLSYIDVRLFGLTLAIEKVSRSIYGALQISHGVNVYPDASIYSEQIGSPYASSSGKTQKTLGMSSRVDEAHYAHSFSVNPNNSYDLYDSVGDDGVTEADKEALKEAMKVCATHYTSSTKTGVENECLIWIDMAEGSNKIIPSIANMVSFSKEGGKSVLDVGILSDFVSRNAEHIKGVSIYYDKFNTEIRNGLNEFQYDYLH